MRLAPLVIVPVLALAAACSDKPDAPPPRTPEQQRTVDSTIGASRLPGAGGVQGALAAQDSQRARQARLDSIAKAP